MERMREMRQNGAYGGIEESWCLGLLKAPGEDERADVKQAGEEENVRYWFRGGTPISHQMLTLLRGHHPQKPTPTPTLWPCPTSCPCHWPTLSTPNNVSTISTGTIQAGKPRATCGVCALCPRCSTRMTVAPGVQALGQRGHLISSLY